MRDHILVTCGWDTIPAILFRGCVETCLYFLNGMEVLSALSKHTYTITMAWVPSYCPIPGNKNADSVAIDGVAYRVGVR